MSGWIGVDLDGTLAHYAGWKDGEVGEPIMPMLNRVKGWLAEGQEVRIFTARVGTYAGMSPEVEGMIAKQREVIQDWTEKHIGARLPVTCTKDFAMIELWDDRCVQVGMNTGEPLAVVGPTGKFPDGKIRDDDNGELRIAIGKLNGEVFVQLGTPTEWISGPPEWARGLAALLIKRADELEASR